MKKTTLLFIVLLLFTCNSNDDNNSNEPDESFNVKALLSAITNQQILTAVDDFLNESNTLNATIENYLITTTENNLNSVRNQWKQTALAYGKIYAFNIGMVRDQFMHQALFNWPTLPLAIENVISDNSEITEELIASISPQIKTLSGLEYLLFESDTASVNAAFSSSEKRKNYLKFIALEFKSQAERLQNIWESPTNYSETFINNEYTGIRSSFNRLYNGIFNLIDTGKVTKIGKPAGLENSQNTDIEIIQARFSKTSLAILKSNIESVEAIYFNPQGLGIDDYAFSIMDNSELNTAIKNKIEDVKKAIETIPVPLIQAITLNPNEVKNLHEELKALGILFSVDVRSVLSIIITTTDNDGD